VTISLCCNYSACCNTYSLGDTLCNDGNRSDLRVLHQLHGGAVDTSRGSEVHHCVHVTVLLHRLAHTLVDGEQGLACAPVHLAHELTTESVDDTCHGWGLSLADEVEVQHALHGSWLESVDEASGLVVEEGVFSTRAQRATGRRETSDVVVGRQSSLDRWRNAIGGTVGYCSRHIGCGLTKDSI
jgi:hypothetical protein